ncbi:response regulator transcription factor [Rhodocytophaga rosea]|uniref:Response regulator transcription factor n=1 Tax=Rhodocytophaga rosea TaxID=2704465 RepID=A0A6C0GPX9_9BACT|nr:response regulator transcription factor [Rhodocytophaga rosea]QHT69977.1 response regulator transcription factor [Rhodocytophaga rosea]
MLNKYITISVLACEDGLREGLRAMMDSTYGYQVVGSYKSGLNLITHLKEKHSDVVFAAMDCYKDHQAGSAYPEFIRKIKGISPKTKLILFTDIETEEAILQLLKAGIDGYITRDSSPVKLLESIKEVFEGGAPLSPSIAKVVVGSFHKNTSSVLSPREVQVLELLARGKTYLAIADALFIDKETVRSHIKNIYWKLEVHSKAEAIQKALYEKII